MIPHVGDLLVTRYSHVHVWDEDLEDTVDELIKGELMLIIAASHPTRKKRLNPEFYRQVLTQSRIVGWVHLDNCDVID